MPTTTPAAAAPCPRRLNWHFTDRDSHTNLDTVDKTSAAEMPETLAAWQQWSAEAIASVGRLR